MRHHVHKTNARRRSAPLLGLALALLLLLGLLPAGASAAAGARHDVVVLGSTTGSARDAVRSLGVEPGLALDAVGGVAAQLSDRQIAALEAGGLVVAADAPLEVSSEQFEESDDGTDVPVAPQIAALEPSADWGPDAGAGVAVALIDTGVSELPELAGRLVHGPDLSGEGTTDDSYGHGTFMAGLIAASSDGSGPQLGVAPSSRVVSVKVAGADGSTSLSRVIAAIGWVIQHGDDLSVRVLNLSLAAPPASGPYHADPLSAAVEAAWASGITVVAAAGNDGDHVSSPGRDPWIVTVGAVDTGSEDDLVPSWSSRERFRTYAKPDLLAPGVSTVSLAAPGSTVVRENPQAVIDGRWLKGTGTSMATALTAGAAAILTSRHAAATPDDIKAALVATGRDVPGELGRVVRLGAADGFEPSDASWQEHKIAFGGLGGVLSDRMPWVEMAGTRWAGTRWAGTRWAGTRWADAEWAGTRWAGTRWAGTRWAGTRWAGTRWADAEWAGTRWAGTRWAGTRWAGTRWASHAWVA